LHSFSLRYIVIRNMARKPRTGPASDPEVLILSSLASGPKHGYAIMSDIESFAGTRLGPGTLYTAITRLAEKKLIKPESSPGRQRPYRLTAEGAAALTELLSDMRRVAAVGLRRLRSV
jgi:DNA-binding PadR family transcriptional regulator